MFREERRLGDNTGPKLIGWPATIAVVLFIVFGVVWVAG